MSMPLRDSAQVRDAPVPRAAPSRDDESAHVGAAGDVVAVPGLVAGDRTDPGGAGASQPRSDVLRVLRQRAADEPPVIRRLVEDADFPSSLSIDAGVAKLRSRLPQHKQALTFPKARGYLTSSRAWTIKQIEADLDGTGSPSQTSAPSRIVSESTTPPVRVEAIISNPQSTAPTTADAPVSRPTLEPMPKVGTNEAETTEAQTTEPIAIPSSPVLTASTAQVDAQPSATGGPSNFSDVATWVDKLYTTTTSPTREQFIAAMKEKKYQEDDLNQPAFVYALQAAVRKNVTGTKFLEDTEVKDVAPQGARTTSWPIYQARWTLRHYTPAGKAVMHGDGADEEPGFRSIRSTASLGINPPPPDPSQTSEKDKKKSGHTTDTDWHKYGNVGNTFFVLCIDGQVASDQAFLKNCKWYAEFDFASIPSLWLSSDWLDESKIKGEAMRGTGEQVKRRLISSIGKVGPQMFVRTLFNMYNNLEVKVPGGLPVGAWNGPVKYPF